MLKRALLISLIFTGIFILNVYGEDIQMTDYCFTNIKAMLDGYDYISYSENYSYLNKNYKGVENNILKPNGTMLYNSTDYDTYFGFFEAHVDNFTATSYNEGYMFPQTVTGNKFVVYEPCVPYNSFSENKIIQNALIDSEGNLIIDMGYSFSCTLSPYYCFNDYTEKVGIFDIRTDKEFLVNYDEGQVFYNKADDSFAVFKYTKPDIYDKTPQKVYVTIEVYKDANKTNTYENEADFSIANSKIKLNNIDFTYLDEGKLTFEGNVYYAVYSQSSAGVYHKGDISPIEMDYTTGNIISDRVDKSYTFKKTEINGTKYYALFKELKDGETAADFAPTEKPAEKYAENIEKMAADKLLFNNELCFFDKGITKLDFGIVLGRALCTATGYNIDNFTSDTHFVDVNHPYCLYLADKGILGSDNDLYINEKAISQSTVLSALNRTAADSYILAEWSKVKKIRNTEEECSRELAYSEIYKLYNLLQNPDTPKDIGATSGIYIIIGSLLILFVGSFLNDKFKCKTVK